MHVPRGTSGTDSAPLSSAGRDAIASLRAACITLLRLERSEASAVCVALHVGGATDDALLLQTVSMRVASEYGLQCRASLHGQSLSVRFTRCPSSPCTGLDQP
jgi:hypothetical protein